MQRAAVIGLAMQRASVIGLVLLASSMRPVSASDCAEHGACCFPRARHAISDELTTSRERWVPRPAQRGRAGRDTPGVAGLVVRGALPRPAVRRVIAAAVLAECGASLRFAVAPNGTVTDVNNGNICPAVRALRFPPAEGVTEVVLALTGR